MKFKEIVPIIISLLVAIGASIFFLGGLTNRVANLEEIHSNPIQFKEADKVAIRDIANTEVSLLKKRVTNLEQVQKEPIQFKEADKSTIRDIARSTISDIDENIYEFITTKTKCQWEEVGWNETVENVGKWCSAGYYIAQLDFNHKPKAHVARAKCCTWKRK